MQNQDSTGLARVIGRWTLTALAINSIIGSGIFGLPSVVAGYIGRWSPLAYFLAAIAVSLVTACFAEVASQFSQSGGPYLYAREAFGRFLGIEMGWLSCLSRATASAAALNLFTSYIAEFWPAAKEPLPRLSIFTVLIGFLAFLNYRGTKTGAVASNVFTIAKLSALLLFVAAGGFFLLRANHILSPALTASAPIPLRNWFEAMLVILFAYGGFEGAVVPMAEAKDPRRDAPFALSIALVTTTILYCLIQYIVFAVLPDAAANDRPLSQAARTMSGKWGAALIAVGALISIYGYLSAQMLHSPRMTFALGEHGDFPSLFSRIHTRYRTPHVSILIFAGIVWSLAALGDFRWNVILSSVTRIFVYVLVAASLPVLRRKHPGTPAFRVPAGDYVAGLGVITMLVLASRMYLVEWIVIFATIIIALANWLLVRESTT